ncbi:MAG: signal peptidase II [Alphaproteobacteria bacterium]
MTGGRSLALGLGLASVVVVLDQVTKSMVLETMLPARVPIEVTSFFNLVLTWNRGVSFGLFNTDSPYNSVVLIALAVLVAIGLGVWLWREPAPILRTALGFIIGGAIGNAIDRYRHDGVVDFLDVHVGNLHWPAFNVADSAITVGAALLLVDALLNGAEPSGK